MPEIILTLDVPQLLNLLLAVIFPVLVGLVTTRVTSSTLKAVLLATISLASGLVSALLTAVMAGAPFDLIAALLTGLAAWIIALATHLGFWKPTGVTEKVQAIGTHAETPTQRQMHFNMPLDRQENHLAHMDPKVAAEMAAKSGTMHIDGEIIRSGGLELTDTEREADYQAEQARRENTLRRDVKGE
jgi:hypothetical protein